MVLPPRTICHKFVPDVSSRDPLNGVSEFYSVLVFGFRRLMGRCFLDRWPPLVVGGGLLWRVKLVAGVSTCLGCSRHPRFSHGQPFLVVNTVAWRQFMPDVWSRLLLPLDDVSAVY